MRIHYRSNPKVIREVSDRLGDSLFDTVGLSGRMIHSHVARSIHQQANRADDVCAVNMFSLDQAKKTTISMN